MPTDFDVVINGVKARIAHTEGDGGYKRRTVRREVQNQLLSQSENPAFRNRDDGVSLYQRSWAGGARWWKPIMGPDQLDTYFESENLDGYSTPGKLKPGNRLEAGPNALIHRSALLDRNAHRRTVYIGSGSVTNATYYDLIFHTPTSGVSTRDVAQHTHVKKEWTPLGMVFNPADDYFYVIHSKVDGEVFNVEGAISRFKYTLPGGSTSTAGDSDWIEFSKVGFGSSIFLTRDGVFFYDGDAVYKANPTGPTADKMFDDGLGVDYLSNTATSGLTNPIINPAINLAINTPEGIYYVKNTTQSGVAQPYVFRLSRDASGVYIGNPIAVLPKGMVALSIAHHLGSLLIAVSPNPGRIEVNDTKHAEVQLYSVGSEGMNALGSMLGNQVEPDETPYVLLGGLGALFYISGCKRLWVYDAARGGIHQARHYRGLGGVDPLIDGPFKSWRIFVAANGETWVGLFGADKRASINIDELTKTITVSNLGQDPRYILTSNYFDGGLPMEEKEVTRVRIVHEPMGTHPQFPDEYQWTVQISADDGPFVTVLQNSEVLTTFAESFPTGIRGRKFQYRLWFKAMSILDCPRLEGLLIDFTTGDMVTEYDLMLDGEELLNVDNELQDPKEFADSMVSLSANNSIITLIDNYQDHGRESSSSSKVKVVAVEITKDTPGESQIRVLLRDV